MGALVERLGDGRVDPWDVPAEEHIRVTAGEMACVGADPPCDWCEQSPCGDPERCADLADHDAETLRAWLESR